MNRVKLFDRTNVNSCLVHRKPLGIGFKNGHASRFKDKNTINRDNGCWTLRVVFNQTNRTGANNGDDSSVYRS